MTSLLVSDFPETAPYALFQAAIRNSGMEPPAVLMAGKFHRFPGKGKKAHNRAGWCKLFQNGSGGVYGDFSRDIKEAWQAPRLGPVTKEERAAFHRATELAFREAEQDADTARQLASEMWAEALPDADQFDYLLLKGIAPHGTKQLGCELLVPVTDMEGVMHSLQRIGPFGDKRFLQGGKIAGRFFWIGERTGDEPLCIAEGFATAVSLHEATGYPAAVAFTASNLSAVAKEMRASFPQRQIVVCADNDGGAENNPAANIGLRRAEAAARGIDGCLAIPISRSCGTRSPEAGFDFNDMALEQGSAAVKDAVDMALRSQPSEVSHEPESWPEPQRLTPRMDPPDYPIEVFPRVAQDAILEVQGFTQAPLALAASSALAAMSIVTQAHADVRRDEGLSGPISLFLIAIAEPGERKTTNDKYFMEAIRDYEAQQRKEGKAAMARYRADLAAWENERIDPRQGRSSEIRVAGKGERAGGPAPLAGQRLSTSDYGKPEKPRVVRFLFNDATAESLAENLANKFPCGALASAEAGSILGGHSMSAEMMMRTLALLDSLWDGQPMSYDRRTSESYAIEQARLTVSLLGQPLPMQKFLCRNDGLARGIGFLSRCLIVYPESTQGSRFYKKAPESWPNLSAFKAMLEEWLNKPISIEADGRLTDPPQLALSFEAKTLWEKFYNQIEKEFGPDGKYFSVRDLVSKVPDNAVRIAAIFHMVGGQQGPISAESMQAGARLAWFYADEMKRVMADFSQTEAEKEAVSLSAWITRKCREKGILIIPKRWIQQSVTPAILRQPKPSDRALEHLQANQHIRRCPKVQGEDIAVNPALLK